MTQTAATPAPAAEAAPPIADHRLVPIRDVFPSPLNPRRTHTGKADPDLDDLVASIREHGLLEPILVRTAPEDGASTPTDGHPRYEIIAGFRRRRAAALAGLTEIPVIIREVSDQQLLELALAENLHRRAMTPLDEARALERLQQIDLAYRDIDVLAVRIGRSGTYVRNRLKLLRLTEAVQAALDAEAITTAHAERIARLPEDLHLEALAACFSSLLLHPDDDDASADAIEQAIDQAVKAHDEEDDIRALIVAGRFDILGPALKSLGDLDGWVTRHGKVDLADPEVQQQLLAAAPASDDPDDPDGAAGDDADEELLASLVQLSESDDWAFSAREAKAAGVLHRSKWRELTEADLEAPCKYAKRGVVVHGGDTRLVTFCASKRCESHWPKPKASRGGEGKPDWQVAQERREADRKAWEAERATHYPALVAHLTKRVKTITPDLLNATRLQGELRRASQTFKLKVTPKTLPVLLALSAIDLDDRPAFIQSCKRFRFSLATRRGATAGGRKAAAPRRGRKTKPKISAKRAAFLKASRTKRRAR